MKFILTFLFVRQKGSDYQDWWKVREIFGLNTLVIYKHVGFELIVFGILTTSIQLLFQFISEACFAKHKLICRLYNESASHMSYFPALLDFYFISLAAILNPRGFFLFRWITSSTRWKHFEAGKDKGKSLM